MHWIVFDNKTEWHQEVWENVLSYHVARRYCVLMTMLMLELILSKQKMVCFKVKWTSDGEAVLHINCWTDLKKDIKSKDTTVSEKEQDLVKEATKTAEFHNSEETLKQEAAKIAELLRKSEYCIAFTGSSAVKTNKSVYVEQLRPTYTHEALVKLVEMNLIKFVISQNTDGLHRLSGIPKSQISELHGNSFTEKCEKCETRYERNHACRGKSSAVPAKKCDKCRINHRTGRVCDDKQCGGYLMNTIINFGDYLEDDVLGKAKENAEKADLVIALGTTLQVSPANSLVEMGKQPVRLVICNRQVTPYDNDCQHGSRVYGDCDKLMRALMNAVLTKEELQAWEAKKDERMAQYDLQRVKIR
ncbi:hypothetical protein KUTeg_004137 [Tegillarca granosa]|uniref:protein acetyllysine N-acetyltransferase n=1 Tax=Tegillarca granosa TaxID=220873 RepID=A0ABQ9FS95_TEGGR|nr:hypothetical protein KUTeg_004137 [Tegillarca granosa]